MAHTVAMLGSTDMASLNEAQQDILVGTALKLDAQDRVQAIGGLLRGLAHMSGTARNNLMSATADLIRADMRTLDMAPIFAGLAASMASLTGEEHHDPLGTQDPCGPDGPVSLAQARGLRGPSSPAMAPRHAATDEAASTPPTSWHDLPITVFQEIAGHLPRGPDNYRTIWAFANISEPTRAVIASEYDEYRLAVKQLCQLVDELSDDDPGHAEVLRPLAGMLGLVSANRCRRILVNATAARWNHESKARAQAVAVLGSAAMASLDEEQQDFLVGTALKHIFVVQDRVQAIGGLLRGLAHMGGTARNNLMSATATLLARADMGTLDIAPIFGGLAASMASLTGKERDGLFAAMARARMYPDDCYAKTLRDFGPGVAHLNKSQCQSLVDTAVNIEDRASRRTAIAGLVAGLAHFSKPQQEQLVRSALALDTGYILADMVHRLGAELQHLSPPLREQVFAAALHINDPNYRAFALGGLGRGAAHLSEAALATLITEITCTATDHEKYQARDVMAGMAHLSPLQRECLVDAMLGMNDEFNKAPVLARLGAAAAHLSRTECERALAATMGLEFEAARAEAIAGWGRGMAHLDERQQGRLIAAATGLSEDDNRAEALSGLAAGMPDLSAAQYQELIEAAKSLQAAEPTRARVMAELVCARIRL